MALHVTRMNWLRCLFMLVCPAGSPCDDFGCTQLREFRCNGKIDCSDGSDEDNCDGPPSTDKSSPGGCKFDVIKFVTYAHVDLFKHGVPPHLQASS